MRSVYHDKLRSAIGHPTESVSRHGTQHRQCTFRCLSACTAPALYAVILQTSMRRGESRNKMQTNHLRSKRAGARARFHSETAAWSVVATRITSVLYTRHHGNHGARISFVGLAVSSAPAPRVPQHHNGDSGHPFNMIGEVFCRKFLMSKVFAHLSDSPQTSRSRSVELSTPPKYSRL